MKRYYLCIRKRGTDVWHATEMTVYRQLMKAYDFVIPLERKPRSAEIKEG